MILTYDGACLGRFADIVEIRAMHVYEGLPDRHWQRVAERELAKRHAIRFPDKIAA